MRSFRAVAALCSLAIALASGALADDQVGKSQSQVTQGSQQHGFTDRELDRFVAVQSRLVSIQKQYKEKLNQAQRPTEERKLKAEAQQKMLRAIRKEGMTVKKYTQITSRVREDPELKQKLQKRLQEAQ